MAASPKNIHAKICAVPLAALNFLARHPHIATYLQEIHSAANQTGDITILFMRHLAMIIEPGETIPPDYFAELAELSQAPEFTRLAFNQIMEHPAPASRPFQDSIRAFHQAIKKLPAMALAQPARLMTSWLLICKSIWQLRIAFAPDQSNFNWIDE